MIIKEAPPHRRAEAELFLGCARVAMDEERAGRIKTLAGKAIDWDYLLDIALQHGVTPLLYWHLNAICPDAVPAHMLAQLRNNFCGNAKHNLLLTGELLNLLDQFEKCGIRAISYKGPLLAKEIYGNLALRVFGDLDILVLKEDLVKTTELLVSRGYRPRYSYTKEQEIAHLGSGHAYTFERDDGRIHVDLHWRIAQSHFSFAVDPEDLWARSALLSFANKSVRKLSSEDLLLIVCIHGARHCWERLGWVGDVAEILATHEEMNWEALVARSEKLRSRRVLLLGLTLAKELLGAALPKTIAEEVKTDQKLRTLAHQVFAHMFAHQTGLLKEVRRTYLYFQMRERFPHKIPYFTYCVRRALTPNGRDRDLLRLPAILAPLYFIFRPLRLIAVSTWLAVKHVYHAKSAE
jgi:hypothetical protein